MRKIVWAILRHNEGLLLVRRSDGIWYFPDETEVRLEKEWFKKLCYMHFEKYQIQCLYCDKWREELMQKNKTKTEWFTLTEIYSLGKDLSILIDNNLMLIAYLIQHYIHHPIEWGLNE